jgi:hypothetical protein
LLENGLRVPSAGLKGQSRRLAAFIEPAQRRLRPSARSVRQAGADDPSSILANEAAAEDEQLLVGALPTAASGLVVWSPCQLRADAVENIADGLLWFSI